MSKLATIKAWWLAEGWPWLKEYWWVVLLLPLFLIVAVAMFAKGRPVVNVVEPLRGADDRARIEAETRVRQLETEKKRLESELELIRGRYTELQAQMEAGLATRVDALREDPEKLREAMLAAGRGKR